MMRIIIIIAIMALCLPSTAHAEIGISEVGDMTLGTWNIGDPAVKGTLDVCVYSTLLGVYGITAAGGNGYTLANGSHQIPYSLYWNDGGAGQLGNTNGTPLNNNVMLAGQVNGNTRSSTCASGAATGPNARLTLVITQADMAAALSGTYSGTITLMVSPI